MSRDSESASLGFLTIVQHELHGLFGGYLLLNVAGRPLEFHCTAPVKPNRAQQILYGPTLEPYLYGEHIGATLIKASPQVPLAVFVQQIAALAVRQHMDIPTALVSSHNESPATAPSEPVFHASTDAAMHAFQSTGNFQSFTIGQNRLLVPTRYSSDRDSIVQRLSFSDEYFDFTEPFQRIRSAIEEAQRATAKAA